MTEKKSDIAMTDKTLSLRKGTKQVKALPKKTRALIRHAIKVRERAYAPYSNYRVGCALRDAHGNIHSGCNVENANFGGTICAERSAVVKMVSRGCQEWEEVVVVTASEEPALPCGDCRQFLNELGPDGVVYAVNTQGTHYLKVKMRDLLPFCYNQKDLESGAGK